MIYFQGDLLPDMPIETDDEVSDDEADAEEMQLYK